MQKHEHGIKAMKISQYYTQKTESDQICKLLFWKCDTFYHSQAISTEIFNCTHGVHLYLSIYLKECKILAAACGACNCNMNRNISSHAGI